MRLSDEQRVPLTLLPAYAPLPAPFVHHLVMLEYRKASPSGRPPPEQVWRIVQEYVEQARAIVYEYMHPFILREQMDLDEGYEHAFPHADWLLEEALPAFSTAGKRYTRKMLDGWIERCLLRSEDRHQTLDAESVAALLILLMLNTSRQRDWLPERLAPGEASWWCYSQSSPTESVIPMPVPNAAKGSTLVWTPWLGAAWPSLWRSSSWRAYGDVAIRWSDVAAKESDIARWDAGLAGQMIGVLKHVPPPFLRSSVRATLLVDARDILLKRFVAHLPERMEEMGK